MAEHIVIQPLMIKAEVEPNLTAAFAPLLITPVAFVTNGSFVSVVGDSSG
jgi:hypothetical protein